jgi:hypothetical protein
MEIYIFNGTPMRKSAIVLFCLVWLSCQKESPRRQYQETVPAAVPSHVEPGAGHFTWTVPEGWTALEATGMRLGAFSLPGDKEPGECTIIVLAGQAGGRVANLRRWMDQVKLTVPADTFQAFLTRAGTETAADGTVFTVYDLNRFFFNPQASSIVAALAEAGSKTVFVKMTGRKKVLEDNQTKFTSLIKSIKCN